MLKIIYNKDSTSQIQGHITLEGTFLSISLKDENLQGSDMIEALGPYHSYILTKNPQSMVKNFRTVTPSDFKFLDMNRLGVAIRMDYTEMSQLYGKGDVIQIDTGMICPQEKDIVVRVFEGQKENFTINTDIDYVEEEFESSKLPTQSHPRMNLWDSYELTVDGKAFQANRKGDVLLGDPSIPIALEAGKEYIDFSIQKYKGNFDGVLEREIDNEEVFIESSLGLINNRRVRLVNGKGSFRLYPFGATGAFKLKLGRKFYEVWNEYSLILGDLSWNK